MFCSGMVGFGMAVKACQVLLRSVMVGSGLAGKLRYGTLG